MGNKQKILAIIVVFIAGLSTGYFLRYLHSPHTEVGKQVRQSGYKFINPLVECEVDGATHSQLLSSFREDVKKLTDEEIKRGRISSVSVYFRDLGNGPWFGINESENFTPASLLKVPLALAYFKKDEFVPGTLLKEVEYKIGSQLGYEIQNIVPKEKLEIGKKYYVKELIRRMLVYSDNDAAQLLLENIDIDSLNKTFPDFGLNVPDASNGEDMMSVVSYASFFRILFNGAYLNNENSERFLEIMSQSDFKDGIVAGLPANLVVSHKFGERKSTNNFGEKVEQLHDCGVIYYPEHPYLLCIMSKGDNFPDMANAIEDISRLIYDKIDSEYR